MTVYTPKKSDGGSEKDRAANSPADERAESRSMSQVSHTNPYTDESFGESQVYNRGRVAIVDGGEADDEADADAEDGTIGDVDHTPREDAPSTHEVYERGGEGEVEDEAATEDEGAAEDDAAAEDRNDVPEVGEE